MVLELCEELAPNLQQQNTQFHRLSTEVDGSCSLEAVLVDYKGRFINTNVRFTEKICGRRMRIRPGLYLKGEEETSYPENDMVLYSISTPWDDPMYLLLPRLMKLCPDINNLAKRELYFETSTEPAQFTLLINVANTGYTIVMDLQILRKYCTNGGDEDFFKSCLICIGKWVRTISFVPLSLFIYLLCLYFHKWMVLSLLIMERRTVASGSCDRSNLWTLKMALIVKEKEDNVRNLLSSGRRKIVTCCKDIANRVNHLAVSRLTEVTVASVQEEGQGDPISPVYFTSEHIRSM
ncbi:hypothetical protein UY3_03263 [Chelonia mydas]|uniref:Uncharacterized protein n=1 Tax=Chelonia mydas TaxID=8469 RepID=M7C4T1_CHEMY|nr:hypothetical protein UY3_03263 [Chelonia mydas]